MRYSTIFLAVILAAGLQNNFAAEPDLRKLAVANNTFTLKLVNQIIAEQPGKNIFISPYSAATALQMAANGAGGQTKTEMQKVLGTSGIAPDELNAASQWIAHNLTHPKTRLERRLGWLDRSHFSDAEFNTFSNRLVQSDPDLLKPDATNIVVTANALFYRQGSAIKSGFVEENQKYFASTVKALDFSNPPAAEAVINRWAGDQTQGRVTGIADGMIDPDNSDLILLNAIYFNGTWGNPFDPKLTKQRRFHPASGASKKVPMMEVSAKFFHHKNADYEFVSLPYQDAPLAMFVLLPAPGSSPAKLLQQTMNGDDWVHTVFRDSKCPKGHLVLPKFKLENNFKLIEPLKALGMKSAFDPIRADFTGMFDDQGHCITKVRQKTFVAVDEAGTEAAAVTEIERGTYGAPEKPPEPFDLVVDRPFLFAIVDWDSGEILFMGVVNEL
ncbi:MAG: serpin family protein [Verrucomicrobiae bacterium]|nr:serpin family protein [Verrucomicrobiae bacterium]